MAIGGGGAASSVNKDIVAEFSRLPVECFLIRKIAEMLKLKAGDNKKYQIKKIQKNAIYRTESEASYLPNFYYPIS